ncbi:HlyD family efflux transporter periplasmic adaptor subunit [Pontibacter diazotrophicus]|uniref:HlyD family efflux transporter periplasmic adaptor subunit n=1 Tax=Pontibacter diazotrophicus TaxID=1400979 RepID=A0A3D8LE01_9BACT|nr:HlyD family efflux transporter periplasmic adaptor subunit [Pontibacter diazotrophicus]RDV15630.1 HlyD family efflux transporter periplasmic adaptor subunit [Pontibacter diazotrophicus]
MAKTVKDKDQRNYMELEAMQQVQTPRQGRILTYWIAGIFLVVVLCLFLPWTQNISSQGTLTALTPQDRPQTIESVIAGRIEKWYLMEGTFVNKGDTIATISEIKEKYMDPNLLANLGQQVEAKQGSAVATGAKAEAMQEQIQALREGLVFSLQKARNKVEQNRLKLQSDSMDVVAQRTELAIAESQFERQENLYEQGLKSLTELEQRRLKLQEAQAKLLSLINKFDASRAELQNAGTELNSLQADYADKIAKAEAELSSTRSSIFSTQADVAKLQSEYTSTQVRSQYYHILAPQTGYLVRTLKAGLGETIKEGEALATIMPNNPQLAAELYVDALDLPLIKPGDDMRLQFEGWPALVFSGWPGASFGTFGGEVAVIDNTGTNGQYRLLVVPDPAQEDWPDALRVGSGVQGWAMLNTVPIWYEIWRQLNNFPADYTGDGTKGTTQNTNKAQASYE